VVPQAVRVPGGGRHSPNGSIDHLTRKRRPNHADSERHNRIKRRPSSFHAAANVVAGKSAMGVCGSAAVERWAFHPTIGEGVSRQPERWPYHPSARGIKWNAQRPIRAFRPLD
jgi:hypothetical protein